MTVALPALGKIRRAWAILLTQQCNDHETFINTSKIIKRLTADTSPVNNSTVLVTISGLTAALEANSAYIFELYIAYSTNVTADLKIAWSLPASAVADFGIDYWDTATVKQFSQSSVPPTGSQHGGFGADLYARFFGSLATGATAGNFTVQFAQNTANVSNSLVRRGSYLWLDKVPV